MIDSPVTLARAESLFPFLTQLPADLRRQLMNHALHAKIPKGHSVCREGNQCMHLALMLSGVARVYKLGENGRDITLYRVESGQSCILTASCILSGTAFPAFAECETEAAAILIPSPRVREWMARSEVFRNYVFSVTAQRLGSLISTVEEVVFRRLDQRLADYLKDRAKRDDAPIRTTHQQIASDLGTSREVISRVLKDMESRCLIRLGRGMIEVLDSRRLARAAHPE